MPKCAATTTKQQRQRKKSPLLFLMQVRLQVAAVMVTEEVGEYRWQAAVPQQ
jgi:hypothetical protein